MHNTIKEENQVSPSFSFFLVPLYSDWRWNTRISALYY